ncbi:MerR family transcriptional regulator [Mycolicibacterium sp. ND9-15]|uniref:MerR family transcriptional regulator n=1 Tax=Mycolicibacterium sp. ND9-15 TaxID=3042320 RepID=UPI002DDA1C3A|nr:MerR family transcriptional regulator [Mycolicibacterium sp. ND9-15]WSE57059.1 MerR family transcriptional regulator [Mycolicibacterium sp. ND9-15]
MSFRIGVNVNPGQVDTLVSRAMDDADKPRYTVRVVAERVGVPTATLRSWSQRYGIGPSHHRPGRHRLYSENDIAAVQHMHELIEQGTSTSSAAELTVESTMPARGDVDAVLSAALELDLGSLGRLLQTHLRHFGVLDTWELIVRPAFEAIVTKQDGGGCVDVEHALSWTVSRTLQATPLAPPGASTSVILGCTPRETHVLPLEALRAGLAERGHGALMLGADVPMSALTDAIARVRSPVRVMLWSQTADTSDMAMVRAAAGAQVLLGGAGWDAISRVDPGVRLHSLRAALECCAADA